jgi:hypothetical protein
MARLAVVDANEKKSAAYAEDYVASIVGHWLSWECRQAGVNLVDPKTADIILLVHAAAKNFTTSCRRALRAIGVQPLAAKRGAEPYIIAGGGVYANPFHAFETADAVAIGEAFAFMRGLLPLVKSAKTLEEIRRWVTDYPYALDRRQVADVGRDVARPWLLAGPAPKLAEPDTYIDWHVPPIRNDDKVVQLIVAKGCPNKCLFCSTSWQQVYQFQEDGQYVTRQMTRLQAAHERVRLVSNDPAALPWFNDVDSKLDAQSFSYRALKNRRSRAAMYAARPSSCRLGIEGLSERIRYAFRKPIPTAGLVELLRDIHTNHVHSHLFFVPCAPYEAESDWAEFRELYYEFSRAITWGICRVKMTTFDPAPPAPLARFVPGRDMRGQVDLFKDWMARQSASRHVFVIWPQGEKSIAVDVAEFLSAPLELVNSWVGGVGTVDLAPDIEDAERLPWEIVKWPWEPSARWRAAEHYKQSLASIPLI